jgi:Helix-turn-helix domain
MATQLGKGRRVIGTQRANLRQTLAVRYKQGASIRQLVNLTDRSYGFIHRLLSESDVAMRSRGGNHARRMKRGG